MDITDTVTFLLSVFFLGRGFGRGFMHSLINPFSIIVTTFLSIVYYQATKDLMMSLAIGAIGPIVLGFFLRIGLGLFGRATDTDIKPNFLSRVGGAVITLAWGWVFIVFTLLLLVILPYNWGKTLENIHNDVSKSTSYLKIAKPMEIRFFPEMATVTPDLSQKVSNVLSNNAGGDAATHLTTASNGDVRSLAEDPRFQEVLQDPEVQKEINAHDIVHLMSNPKMMKLTQELMSDPAALKKVLAVYRTQSASQDNQVNAAN